EASTLPSSATITRPSRGSSISVSGLPLGRLAGVARRSKAAPRNWLALGPAGMLSVGTCWSVRLLRGPTRRIFLSVGAVVGARVEGEELATEVASPAELDTASLRPCLRA